MRLHPVGGYSTKGDFVIVGYDLSIEPRFKKIEKPGVSELLKSVDIEVLFELPDPAIIETVEARDFGWGSGLDHVERIATEETTYVRALYTDAFQPLSRKITGKDGFAFDYYNNIFLDLKKSGRKEHTIDGGKVSVVVSTVVHRYAPPGIGESSGIRYWPPYDVREDGEVIIECDSTITFNTETIDAGSVEYEPVPDLADDFPRKDYYPRVKKKNQQENGGEG
ncbi:MAG: hypothetical protein IKO55_01640 [Kiritimatiellae bacterium]|nr:hypothetical protein [Kiritimatiellia bacterium]